MALPTSGPLAISQIRAILSTSSGSLRYLSSLAGKSTPDAISEFYGYNPAQPCSVIWYNTSYSSSFSCTLSISVNGTQRVWDYVAGDGHFGSLTINQGDSVTVEVWGAGSDYMYLYSHAQRYYPSDYPFSQGTFGFSPYLGYTFTATKANLEITAFVDWP
jgi:hypothetical protein